MQRLLFVFVVLFAIAGCASNPLSKVSNLPEKKLDEVSKVIFPYAKVSAPDETNTLRHWKLSGQLLYTLNRKIADMSLKLDDMPNFGSYCSAIGGKMAEPISLAEGAVEVVCTDKNTNQTIFVVAAGFVGCSALSATSKHYERGGREVACEIWTDAFSWKSPGATKDIDESYKIGSRGFDTLQAVNAELAALQQKREAELSAVRAANAVLMLQQEERRKNGCPPQTQEQTQQMQNKINGMATACHQSGARATIDDLTATCRYDVNVVSYYFKREDDCSFTMMENGKFTGLQKLAYVVR